MPLKGEHLSLEQKQHLREINIGKHHSKESKNKISIGILRYLEQYPINDERRRKNKEAHMGHTVSIETREKLRKVFLGRVLSEETRKKMSESRWGKSLSDNHKRNISIAKIGIHPSNEARLKMSQSHRGLHHTEETKQQLRKKKHREASHRGPQKKDRSK